MWLARLLLACSSPHPAVDMDPAEVTRFVPASVPHREDWAHAVHAGLRAADQPVTADTVCQVLAIIEQESGYAPDPEVPGLADIARRELEAELTAKLGFAGDDLLGIVLEQTADGATTTFDQRLSALRTEQDLDHFTRDLLAHHEAKAPLVGKVLRVVAPRLRDRINPVTTAGSMQVAVSWAQDHPSSRGMTRDEVRDALYTLESGVLYGTLRLFDPDVPYVDPIHRFADYNAGPWASRNAAFQERLSILAQHPLDLDGDLLAYDGRGRPIPDQEGPTATLARSFGIAHGMTVEEVEHDLATEKTRAFEDTDLWRIVDEQWTARQGTPPTYARVPMVKLDSPKLSGSWTTSTFAERTKGRYDTCLTR